MGRQRRFFGALAAIVAVIGDCGRRARRHGAAR